MKKIALVTGANRGIGLATVSELLKLDYQVILTSRNEKAGKEVLSNFSGNENLYYHILDVTKPDSVADIHAFVEEKFGRLDVLINNAGINYDTWQTALTADLDKVKTTLETNLFGAWRMAQAFIPLMKRSGFGRIVNVSSGAGALSNMTGGTPGYSISKAALNVLTIKLASDVKGSNVLVNSVCPGWVRTDMGGSGAPRSPQKGAETIVWAASLPDKGSSGKFFRDKNEIDW